MKIAQAPIQPLAVQDYIKCIATTLCTNDESIRNLADTLQYDLHPFISLGSHKGFRYHLRSTLIELEPDDSAVDWKDARSSTPECILGLNITPLNNQDQSKRRRRADARSDEFSSRNNSTEGNDTTGFTFMQLGIVEYTSDAIWEKNVKAGTTEPEMLWADSGFIAVVAINSDGSTRDVWLI